MGSKTLRWFCVGSAGRPQRDNALPSQVAAQSCSTHPKASHAESQRPGWAMVRSGSVTARVRTPCTSTANRSVAGVTEYTAMTWGPSLFTAGSRRPSNPTHCAPVAVMLAAAQVGLLLPPQSTAVSLQGVQTGQHSRRGRSECAVTLQPRRPRTGSRIGGCTSKQWSSVLGWRWWSLASSQADQPNPEGRATGRAKARASLQRPHQHKHHRSHPPAHGVVDKDGHRQHQALATGAQGHGGAQGGADCVVRSRAQGCLPCKLVQGGEDWL